MSPAKEMNLDFTNVEESSGGQFGRKHYPPGDYKAKVLKVQDAKSKSDNNPMWLFTIQAGNSTYPYYCTFQENTLWKIRNIFVAAGKMVNRKRLKVNPNILIGAEIGIQLDDDEYNGRLRSVITNVFPVKDLQPNEGEIDDLTGEDDEYEPPTQSRKARHASRNGEEDDDEEDEELEAPKAKKKKKKAKVDELEELDVEDI